MSSVTFSAILTRSIENRYGIKNPGPRMEGTNTSTRMLSVEIIKRCLIRYGHLADTIDTRRLTNGTWPMKKPSPGPTLHIQSGLSRLSLFSLIFKFDLQL